MVAASLQERAASGELDRFLVENLADVIAADHLSAPISYDAPRLQAGAPPEIAALMEQRRQAGCVRRANDALRPENITFDGDHIRLAQPAGAADEALDMVQGLAQILKLFRRHGLLALANILFNRYFDVTGGVADDPSTLTVLRWWLEETASRAADSPRLIAVGGLSGGGKSRMARELAPLVDGFPGARVVRTDVVRKRMMGVGLKDRLGSHGYTAEKDDQTYRRFYAELKAVIRQGHPVIADAVFARQQQRDGVEELARNLQVPFVGLWVNAPADVRAARVRQRKNNVSDVTDTVIERQLSYDLGTVGWHQIDSSGPKSKTLEAGRRHLGISL